MKVTLRKSPSARGRIGGDQFCTHLVVVAAGGELLVEEGADKLDPLSTANERVLLLHTNTEVQFAWSLWGELSRPIAVFYL